MGNALLVGEINGMRVEEEGLPVRGELDQRLISERNVPGMLGVGENMGNGILIFLFDHQFADIAGKMRKIKIRLFIGGSEQVDEIARFGREGTIDDMVKLPMPRRIDRPVITGMKIPPLIIIGLKINRVVDEILDNGRYMVAAIDPVNGSIIIDGQNSHKGDEP